MRSHINRTLYLVSTIILACILACGGGDDQPIPSETVTEISTASATNTPAPTATSVVQKTSQSKATPTTQVAAAQTQQQKAIEWVTVQDEFKMYSIRLPKSWETAVMVDDLDQELYLTFASIGSVLSITSADPDSGSAIQIWTDMAQLYVSEPQPINHDAYIDATLDIIRANPDNTSIQTIDITIGGQKGTQIRRLMSGYPLVVNLFTGTVNDPHLMCGSIVPTVQGLYTEPQLQRTVEEIMESFQVLPTAKGEINSCDDRTKLSALE
tara:strand:- start:8086 stop:8889 length:804 start_codon:yes stop_codon:yes gene_type:complete